jgi:hypothetical protein
VRPERARSAPFGPHRNETALRRERLTAGGGDIAAALQPPRPSALLQAWPHSEEKWERLAARLPPCLAHVVGGCRSFPFHPPSPPPLTPALLACRLRAGPAWRTPFMQEQAVATQPVILTRPTFCFFPVLSGVPSLLRRRLCSFARKLSNAPPFRPGVSSSRGPGHARPPQSVRGSFPSSLLLLRFRLAILSPFPTACPSPAPDWDRLLTRQSPGGCQRRRCLRKAFRSEPHRTAFRRVGVVVVLSVRIISRLCRPLLSCPPRAASSRGGRSSSSPRHPLTARRTSLLPVPD